VRIRFENIRYIFFLLDILTKPFEDLFLKYCGLIEVFIIQKCNNI
jgi:hypothetical protein